MTSGPGPAVAGLGALKRAWAGCGGLWRVVAGLGRLRAT